MFFLRFLVFFFFSSRRRHTRSLCYWSSDVCSSDLEFGCGLAAVTPLTMGSWVGGGRDGNPFVTAEITLAAARSARRAVLGHYGRALADLTARLSVRSEERRVGKGSRYRRGACRRRK